MRRSIVLHVIVIIAGIFVITFSLHGRVGAQEEKFTPGVGISKFPTPDKAFESLGDYNFEVVSTDPWHIILYPFVVKDDLEKNIWFAVNRALAYGICRTFVHTPIDAITITVIPRDMATGEAVLGYKKSASVDRDSLFSLIRSLWPTKNPPGSYDYLVGEKKVGEMVFKDQWNPTFELGFMYNEAPPGLTRFVRALVSR